ncbi:Transposon Tf2-8 polyprotein like [Argiope bruennichi]|uniref:Transposon Tf2-8 polyprotein like n=1 Tax=Argiope bruennichi TaxID=94029 RepID=A0A8T0EI89_ARGBR|nr:Transposon Tf2-8 polyprotein like [Argiope bruennichi]
MMLDIWTQKNSSQFAITLLGANMRKDCKAYVRSCHKCQIVNRRTANAYGLLQQLSIPSTPWEIVSADHIICLPETRNGNTNMLVQIDHATRYVIAARHTQRFLQKYGITQSTTPPYSPQANSIVERANGIIVFLFEKMIDKNPNKWDELLQMPYSQLTPQNKILLRNHHLLLHGMSHAFPVNFTLIPFLQGRGSRIVRLAEKRRSQTFSHFQRTICDYTSSRGRVLRDQVYNTAEQIYQVVHDNIFALTLNEIHQPSRKTAQTKRMRATEPSSKRY